MEVNVQSEKNVDITLTPQQPIQVQVTPVATQTIQIDRGIIGPQGPQGPQGPEGPPGTNTIGGYGINVNDPQNYNALMFKDEFWVNIPQEEISDGGNF